MGPFNPNPRPVDSTHASVMLLAQVAPMAQIRVKSEVAVGTASTTGQTSRTPPLPPPDRRRQAALQRSPGANTNASQASTRIGSMSGSSSESSSGANSPRQHSAAPTLLQRRCTVATLDDLGIDLESDKQDEMVCGVATVVTGDASQRSLVRTPASKPPGENGDACQKQFPMRSSMTSRAVDHNVMRTNPVPALGAAAKRSFIDASQRSPAGTVVSTSPPSSGMIHRTSQDASQRNAKPTQEVSQWSPIMGTAASPSEAHCGGDASRRSPIVSTVVSSSEARCVGDASERRSIVSMVPSPPDVCFSMDASQRSPIIGMVPSPWEARCGRDASQWSPAASMVSTIASPSDAHCCGDASQRSPYANMAANRSEAPCDGNALTSWLAGVSGPLPSGDELAEQLRAMAPEVYED